MEVKGVSKSAAESNAAQLEKWTTEALLEHETPHKGILVVNGWRTRQLDARDAVFPNQMLEYSEARGHCLITGIQLYLMVYAVQGGIAPPGMLAEKILQTVGRLEGWDDPSAAFQPADFNVAGAEKGDREQGEIALEEPST